MPLVLSALPRSRMLLFSLAACSAFISVSGLAQSRFEEVDATPYDAQMERVEPVLGMTLGWSEGPISVTTINEWMTGLRAMPYRYSILWKTPAEVEAAQLADCKGKVLLLYEKMRAQGATCLRLVIGRRSCDDPKTHAWLEWETNKGTYLLDPTFYETFTKVGTNAVSTYVPMYAFDYVHKYRAHNYRGDEPEEVAQNSSAPTLPAPSQGTSAMPGSSTSVECPDEPATVSQLPSPIVTVKGVATHEHAPALQPMNNSIQLTETEAADSWVANAERHQPTSSRPSNSVYKFHTGRPPTIVRTARPFSSQPLKGVLRDID